MQCKHFATAEKRLVGTKSAALLMIVARSERKATVWPLLPIQALAWSPSCENLLKDRRTASLWRFGMECISSDCYMNRASGQPGSYPRAKPAPFKLRSGQFVRGDCVLRPDLRATG